jgi:hypothetical protein
MTRQSVFGCSKTCERPLCANSGGPGGLGGRLPKFGRFEVRPCARTLQSCSATECGMVKPNVRQLGAQEAQPLPNSRATFQQKGADLVSDAGALADQVTIHIQSACGPTADCYSAGENSLLSFRTWPRTIIHDRSLLYLLIHRAGDNRSRRFPDYRGHRR